MAVGSVAAMSKVRLVTLVLLSALLGPVSLAAWRSEEHTSELQSHVNLVCRLLLEKKKKKTNHSNNIKPTTHTNQTSIRVHSPIQLITSNCLKPTAPSSSYTLISCYILYFPTFSQS